MNRFSYYWSHLVLCMDLCRSNISWAQSCKHIKVSNSLHPYHWTRCGYLGDEYIHAQEPSFCQSQFRHPNDVPLSRLTVVSVERHEPSPGRDSAHRRTFSQTRRRGCWWQLQSEIGQMPQAEQDKLGPNCLQNWSHTAKPLCIQLTSGMCLRCADFNRTGPTFKEVTIFIL